VDAAGDKVAVRFAPDSPAAPQRLIEVVAKSKRMSLSPEGVVRIAVSSAEEERIAAVRDLLKALL
jgi:hypothetical protein